jgi:hypothetical protein
MVRAGRHVMLLAMIAMLGAGVSAVAGSGAAQAAPTAGRVASVGSVPAIPGWLEGVSADSATDAWAVGYYANVNSGVAAQPVIVHWDGASWSQVPSPNPGSAELYGVSAFSPTNAWAVGSFTNSANVGQTFIVHWDGASWSQVPSPSPHANGDGLTSVSALSATDAWAVGTGTTSTKATRTLILHWNGTVWSRVKSPDPGSGGGEGTSQLFAVSAVSGADAWAVGTASSGPGMTGMYILILHWNGTAWSAA